MSGVSLLSGVSLIPLKALPRVSITRAMLVKDIVDEAVLVTENDVIASWPRRLLHRVGV